MLSAGSSSSPGPLAAGSVFTGDSAGSLTGAAGRGGELMGAEAGVGGGAAGGCSGGLVSTGDITCKNTTTYTYIWLSPVTNSKCHLREKVPCGMHDCRIRGLQT